MISRLESVAECVAGAAWVSIGVDVPDSGKDCTAWFSVGLWQIARKEGNIETVLEMACCSLGFAD